MDVQLIKMTIHRKKFMKIAEKLRSHAAVWLTHDAAWTLEFFRKVCKVKFSKQKVICWSFIFRGVNYIPWEETVRRQFTYFFSNRECFDYVTRALLYPQYEIMKKRWGLSFPVSPRSNSTAVLRNLFVEIFVSLAIAEQIKSFSWTIKDSRTMNTLLLNSTEHLKVFLRAQGTWARRRSVTTPRVINLFAWVINHSTWNYGVLIRSSLQWADLIGW